VDEAGTPEAPDFGAPPALLAFVDPNADADPEFIAELQAAKRELKGKKIGLTSRGR